MDVLIPIGAGVALLGLLGLLYCMWLAFSAKKQGLDEAAMKARLQTVVALNMAAMGISAIGLMMVVIGIML